MHQQLSSMKLLLSLLLLVSTRTTTAEEYLPISESSNSQERQIQWRGKNSLFFANDIYAKFERNHEEEVFDFKDDVIVENTTTPVGQAISFFFGGEDTTDSVRMYFVQPVDDWRQPQENQTYAWKLSQSWMPNDNGWMFWNVEGFVDSQIQVAQPNTVFECDSMEFHYKPRIHGSNRGVFAAHNVKIGAYLQENYNVKTLVSYNPCGVGNQCRVKDGTVSCGPNEPCWSQDNIIILLVGVAACGVLGLGLLYHRRDRTSRRGYTSVTPNTTADDEEAHDGESPKATD